MLVLFGVDPHLFTAGFEAVGFKLQITMREGASKPAEKEGDRTGEVECHGGAGSIRERFEHVAAGHMSARAFGHPRESAVFFEFCHAPDCHRELWLSNAGPEPDRQRNGRELLDFRNAGRPVRPMFNIAPDGPDDLRRSLDVDAMSKFHALETITRLRNPRPRRPAMELMARYIGCRKTAEAVSESFCLNAGRDSLGFDFCSTLQALHRSFVRFIKDSEGFKNVTEKPTRCFHFNFFEVNMMVFGF